MLVQILLRSKGTNKRQKLNIWVREKISFLRWYKIFVKNYLIYWCVQYVQWCKQYLYRIQTVYVRWSRLDLHLEQIGNDKVQSQWFIFESIFEKKNEFFLISVSLIFERSEENIRFETKVRKYRFYIAKKIKTIKLTPLRDGDATVTLSPFAASTVTAHSKYW